MLCATNWRRPRSKQSFPPSATARTLRSAPHDSEKYKWRNLIERLFNKLKNWRCIATRYDKTSQSHLGFVVIAAVKLWLPFVHEAQIQNEHNKPVFGRTGTKRPCGARHLTGHRARQCLNVSGARLKSGKAPRDICSSSTSPMVMFRRRRSLSKQVDLNEAVGEMFRILSAQAAARGVKLDKKLAPHQLPVIGDRVQLEQVILNLVVNGIDAVADIPNEVREIACTSWTSDGPAHVSIRDSGPGIPSDRLERLFEPFFTPKQEGMGMGLCIAHTIIESNGGKISVESDASSAVFHVSLPPAKTARSNMQDPALNFSCRWGLFSTHYLSG
jgi:hypothetical protein